MFSYNKDGTARIVWKKDNPGQLVLHVNEHEAPDRDPEVNAIFQAQNRFGGKLGDYEVYTIDFSKEKDIEAIENFARIINEPMLYASQVKFTDDGKFDTIRISEKNPDPEFAQFNPETFSWDLPENYNAIQEDRKTEEEERTLLGEIGQIEHSSIRSLSAIVEALVSGKKPNEEDLKYFLSAQEKKITVRNKFSNVRADKMDRLAKREKAKEKKEKKTK